MKFLLASLFVVLFNICFGQKFENGTFIFNNDTLKLYHGSLSKVPTIKGSSQIMYYVQGQLSNSTYDHIKETSINGKEMYQIVLTSTGKVAYATVKKSLDSLVDYDLIEIFKKAPWEPAIDLDGKPQNYVLHIPVMLNTDNRKRK